MRIPSSSILFSALLSGLVSASGFDCAHINVDGYKYDLSQLGGVHELYHSEKPTEDLVVNTTYVLNICNILGGASIRGHLKCGTTKNICGFQYKFPVNGSEETAYPFPIVGLDHLGHGSKDPEITRLKQIDSEQEGLLVKLAGGEYKDNGKTKDARAVIEFQCDPDRSGLEGLVSTEDTPLNNEGQAEQQRRQVWAQEENNDQPLSDGTDPSRSLQFKSFGPADDDSYVLKLNWKTRYACDNYQDPNKDKTSHWGFFTWFIIIVFLGVAAYLIFGSWLNYNRHGARGWDLLPHGDTIRDIPYIFQDWVRRVFNTLQGSGSRGGYSAV